MDSREERKARVFLLTFFIRGDASSGVHASSMTWAPARHTFSEFAAPAWWP